MKTGVDEQNRLKSLVKELKSTIDEKNDVIGNMSKEIFEKNILLSKN